MTIGIKQENKMISIDLSEEESRLAMEKCYQVVDYLIQLIFREKEAPLADKVGILKQLGIM